MDAFWQNRQESSLDIDYQIVDDNLPYSSEEQMFDEIFQLCSDGWLDCDLAIKFFNTISFLSTFRIP